MERVSIVKCGDYQPSRVYEAVTRSINLLGGMSQFIKPGMKVLLKCNLLMRKKPEEATTTHPEIVAAAARLVREAGAVPTIADSPGGLFTERALRGVYRACGIEEIAARDQIQLNYNVEEAVRPHPQGKIIKSLAVIRAIEEADAVINIAKLKTHGMTLYGAVKNLFWCNSRHHKSGIPSAHEKLKDFSDVLVDICTMLSLSCQSWTQLSNGGAGTLCRRSQKVGQYWPAEVLSRGCCIGFSGGIPPGRSAQYKGQKEGCAVT